MISNAPSLPPFSFPVRLRPSRFPPSTPSSHGTHWKIYRGTLPVCRKNKSKEGAKEERSLYSSRSSRSLAFTSLSVYIYIYSLPPSSSRYWSSRSSQHPIRFLAFSSKPHQSRNRDIVRVLAFAFFARSYLCYCLLLPHPSPSPIKNIFLETKPRMVERCFRISREKDVCVCVWKPEECFHV